MDPEPGSWHHWQQAQYIAHQNVPWGQQSTPVAGAGAGTPMHGGGQGGAAGYHGAGHVRKTMTIVSTRVESKVSHEPDTGSVVKLGSTFYTRLEGQVGEHTARQIHEHNIEQHHRAGPRGHFIETYTATHDFDHAGPSDWAAMQGNWQPPIAAPTGGFHRMPGPTGGGAQGFGTLRSDSGPVSTGSMQGGASQAVLLAVPRGPGPVSGASGGGMSGLLAGFSRKRQPSPPANSSPERSSKVSKLMIARPTGWQIGGAGHVASPPIGVQHSRSLNKDKSVRLGLPGVNVEPRISFDTVLRILDASPAPRPTPVRLCWPKPERNFPAYIDFTSQAARRRAFSLLYGRACGPRFLTATPSLEPSTLQESRPPSNPPLRLSLDFKSVHLSRLERLEKACGEAGIKLLQPGLKGAALLDILGYKFPFVAEDRHCLFRAFTRIAEALDTKLSLSNARAVAADEWTEDAWESIVALYGTEGDGPRTAMWEWEWMERACGPDLREPSRIVHAYKQGVRTSDIFRGGETELVALAKHVGVNVLLINESLGETDWPWTGHCYHDRFSHPHTVILSFHPHNAQYDVVAFDGHIIFDTANLPAVVKTLHCVLLAQTPTGEK